MDMPIPSVGDSAPLVCCALMDKPNSQERSVREKSDASNSKRMVGSKVAMELHLLSTVRITMPHLHLLPTLLS